MKKQEEIDRMDGDDGAVRFLQDNGHGIEMDKKKSLWGLCRDKRHRGKFLHSICLSLSLFSVMVIETQPGPTFLDLQIITRSGFEEASKFFTVHTAGFLLGCMLGGWLPKKMNADLLIALNVFAMGTLAIVTPLCSPYYLMLVIRMISGIPAGIVETAIYAEQMRIWGQEGRSVTQLVIFLASIGLVLSPIISEPFLAARPNATTEQDSDNNTSRMLTFSSNEIVLSPNPVNLTNISVVFSGDSEEEHPTTDVFYAFLITGAWTILTSAIHCTYFCVINNQSESDMSPGKNRMTETEINYREISTTMRLSLIFGLCLFYSCVSVLNFNFMSLQMTFLVNEYVTVTKSQIAFILTLYLCCGIAARLVLTFLADRFQAAHLLTFFTSLVFVGVTLFTVAAIYEQIHVVFVLIGVVGFAVGPMLPLTLSWSQAEYLQVTSFESSCLMTSSAFVIMLNPIFVSHLMAKIDNMWFCYLHEVIGLLALFLLAILLVVNRHFLNHKYGPLRVTSALRDGDVDRNI